VGQCSICASEVQSELEGLANQALRGDISWREAARLGGLTHPAGLQNHMEKHYISDVEVMEAEVQTTLEQKVVEAKGNLMADFDNQPPDVQALRLVAAHNLDGLLTSKPSQAHLMAALKAVHEIQGLKTENQLLLAFANRKFNKAVTASPAPALTRG